MKKLILAAILWLMAVVAGVANAACTNSVASEPNGFVITQWNEKATGKNLITLANPTATDGILVWRKSTQCPAYLQIGSGFSLNAGVLSVAAGTGSQGPAGPVGPQGPQGIPGKDGAPGRDGVDGAPGATGAQGIQGVPGKDGAVGATGATGAAGKDGKDGASITGPAGPTGATGAAGRDGTNGKDGATGATGAQGPKGDTGATGAQGPAGTPAPTFNFGLPVARTLAVSAAYQASTSTKPAIITVSPVCTAALTLSGGGTCTLQARIGAAGLTCSTGTVVATWTNGNTGALTIGLALNQIIGSPYGINLPTGAYFVLCPTAGTFTITAAEQTAG